MTAGIWSVIEAEPCEWWAVDSRSGTAFSLPEDTGERLWKFHELLELPLAQAIQSRTHRRALPFVDLEFLGVLTRYVCSDLGLAERLSKLYAAATPALRGSPDVLVRLHPCADIERLHRAVSTDRLGVDLRSVAVDEWEAGSSEVPIIPPLQSSLLTGRFCGLHAALLSTSRGGILICGAQRSGKTSAALFASRGGFAGLLADEMVLIDSRGGAHGIPLPLRERTRNARDPEPIPKSSQDVGERISIKTVIILDKTLATPAWTPVMPVEERVRLLAKHIRALDGPLGRATASVLKMLRGANVWLWQLRSWPALMDDIEHGFCNVLNLNK